MAITLALVNHATNRFWIEWTADAIYNDLSDRDLTFDRLVARFEVNRGGHAAQLAGAKLVLRQPAE